MRGEAQRIRVWLVRLVVSVVLGLAAPAVLTQTAAASPMPPAATSSSLHDSYDHLLDFALPAPIEANGSVGNGTADLLDPSAECAKLPCASVGFQVERVAPSRIPGASSVDEALSGLNAGRSSGVRVVQSAEELDDLFAGLSRGGTQLDSAYPGKIVQLPDGTTVGLRGVSRSGGPTLDVRLPDGRTIKVHVDP